MPDLVIDRLAQVALTGHIFDQKHFTGVDDAGFAVTSGDLYAVVEVDDVLPARRASKSSDFLAQFFGPVK